MKTELVKFQSELCLLEKSKAEQIRRVFLPMSDMLDVFDDYYEAVINEAKKGITKEVTVRAKRLRLDIVKVRAQTEKARKLHKKEYLVAGRAIDGVSNILKWAIAEKEEKLKGIENYFEEQEIKRIEEIIQKERETEEQERLAIFTKEKEEREKKEQAEKEERERIRKENEQLKQESAERMIKEKLDAIDREKKETERKDREEMIRKERETFEQKLRKEQERVKEETEKNLKLKKNVEILLIAEKERKETNVELSDQEKAESLINDLRSLQNKYTFSSSTYKKMYICFVTMIDDDIDYVKQYDKDGRGVLSYC